MTITNGICPVCGHPGLASTVKRVKLPAMQNYVFRRIELAQKAESGQFDLAACPDCGFAHNISFDSNLLDYNESYDNRVPSSVIVAYYKEIATYLHETYSIDKGLIVDVGCGKGTFLKIVSEMFPKARGLGIDPSYEGDKQISNGRISFIKDLFSEKHIGERPSVVICRHVLEHISHPVSFLKSIHSALEAFPQTPLFLEVPDTTWIIQNGAFWDFCYEHCNYFTPHSLSNALKMAGFAPPHTIGTAFGNQYIWIESNHPKGNSEFQWGAGEAASANIVSKLTRYSDNELALISEMRKRLCDLRGDGYLIAI